jgi:uroporphyrinogen-III decarboxylase
MTLQDKIEHTNAIADAIQRQEKFYIISRGCMINPLPTPQVAGTMVQRRSYAMGKAMDILNTLSL